MKQLMLGNEAVARGLYEAGCSFVSSYPGTPSTEITEAIAKYREVYAEWAPNEKVAMEAAFGASLAGSRSFCGMKHVGLNVAADPLFTISYTGVNAGMVIGVADDAGMHSSQNEQDSRHYAMAAKIPMLEPSDSAEALEFTKAIILCADALVRLMKEFVDFKKSKTIQGLLVEVNSLEEQCDRLFMNAMRTLHTTCTDALEIIAWREIFIFLEKCADACEHAADVVERIVMKNT